MAEAEKLAALEGGRNDIDATENNTPDPRPVTRDNVRAVLDGAYCGRRGTQATT